MERDDIVNDWIIDNFMLADAVSENRETTENDEDGTEVNDNGLQA